MPERPLSTEKLCDGNNRFQRGLLLFVSEKFSLTPPPDLNVEIEILGSVQIWITPCADRS